MNTLIRNDFLGLNQKVNGKSLVYLDSAATTLKPKTVIDRVCHFNTFEIANIHRGAHALADRATAEYENTRAKVAKFIGASHAEEVIFVKGTTEGVNLIANTLLGEKHRGKEIIISELEHHANIVPWQMVAEKLEIKIKVLPVNQNGEISIDVFKSLISKNTCLLALTHCSNALGTIIDVSEFIRIAKNNNIFTVIDGAQAIGKMPVNVSALGCDFYVFSGHKMFAPFGVGIVYGRKDILENLPPYQGGGSMISKVSFEGTTYNSIPFRFEAGTPNVEAVIGLSSALDYIDSIGLSRIEEIEEDLLSYTIQQINKIDGIKIYGAPLKRAPLISFAFRNYHSSDVGQILDKEGIAIRTGHHCAQPLMRALGVSGTARVSLSIYNNYEDIDRLVKGLEKVERLLG